MFILFEIIGICILPLLIGIAELLKRYKINVKYIPFVNVSLGIIFGIYFNYPFLKYGIISGFTFGIASLGLYDLMKYSKKMFRK